MGARNDGDLASFQRVNGSNRCTSTSVAPREAKADDDVETEETAQHVDDIVMRPSVLLWPRLSTDFRGRRAACGEPAVPVKMSAARSSAALR